MTRLISFGCSWTFGVGLSWEPDITYEEFKATKKQEDVANKYSFRSLLAKEFGLENINHAVGGSSNQRQFRVAEKFDFKKNDIVLWGITSTARNEIWVDTEGDYKKIFYSQAAKCDESDDFCKLIKMTVKHWHNHEEEVKRIFYRIKHYNDYFKCKGVKVLWYDTLNHHNYQQVPDNMLYGNEDHRDLLSRLCKINGYTNLRDRYHFSIGKSKTKKFVDCGRIDFISKNGIANPFSGHPTKAGHRQIADMIRPFIISVLQS